MRISIEVELPLGYDPQDVEWLLNSAANLEAGYPLERSGEQTDEQPEGPPPTNADGTPQTNADGTLKQKRFRRTKAQIAADREAEATALLAAKAAAAAPGAPAPGIPSPSRFGLPQGPAEHQAAHDAAVRGLPPPPSQGSLPPMPAGLPPALQPASLPPASSAPQPAPLPPASSAPQPAAATGFGPPPRPPAPTPAAAPEPKAALPAAPAADPLAAAFGTGPFIMPGPAGADGYFTIDQLRSAMRLRPDGMRFWLQDVASQPDYQRYVQLENIEPEYRGWAINAVIEHLNKQYA